MACVMPGELSLQPFLTPTSHPFRPPPRKSYYGTATSTVHQDYRCRTVGSRCCIHNINPPLPSLYSSHSPPTALLLRVSPGSYPPLCQCIGYSLPRCVGSPDRPFSWRVSRRFSKKLPQASYITQGDSLIAEYKGSGHSDAVVTSSRACVSQRGYKVRMRIVLYSAGVSNV